MCFKVWSTVYFRTGLSLITHSPAVFVGSFNTPMREKISAVSFKCLNFLPQVLLCFEKTLIARIQSVTAQRVRIPKLSMFPHSVSACSSAISTCNSHDPETYHSAFPTAWSVTIMLQTKPKHFTLILVGAKLFPGQQPRTLIIFYCFSRCESVWPSHSKQAKQLISLGKAFCIGIFHHGQNLYCWLCKERTWA